MGPASEDLNEALQYSQSNTVVERENIAATKSFKTGERPQILNVLPSAGDARRLSR